jgi:oligosaccharide reducing-end xylanase
MALFFASARWGDMEPPLDYSVQARRILRACVHKGGLSMWDAETKLIKFVPETPFTDPSYHLPHFYEQFAPESGCCRPARLEGGCREQRKYLHAACNPKTERLPT